MREEDGFCALIDDQATHMAFMGIIEGVTTKKEQIQVGRDNSRNLKVNNLKWTGVGGRLESGTSELNVRTIDCVSWRAFWVLLVTFQSCPQGDRWTDIPSSNPYSLVHPRLAT